MKVHGFHGNSCCDSSEWGCIYKNTHLSRISKLSIICMFMIINEYKIIERENAEKLRGRTYKIISISAAYCPIQPNRVPKCATYGKRTDMQVSSSLSDTEHTAYTVGHPCKPYIQPNQPWPYRSYTRAIPVYT